MDARLGPWQPPPKPDVLKLVYADGALPVAHANFKVMALGKQSDPSSDLQDDFEAWVSKTDGVGEVWLASPVLLQGMDLLHQVLKREHPYMLPWEYIPPPAKQNTNVSGYPKVPLVIRIDDQAVSAPLLELELRPGVVNTQQSRPPIAELNGRAFMDPTDFLKQLAQRFSTMTRDRRAVSIKLTRCGSPSPFFPLESSWGQLMLQLGTTRSDWQITTAFKRKFSGLRDHVGVSVLGNLLPARGASSKKPAGDQYLDLLNQLAGLGPSATGPFSKLTLDHLVRGLIQGLGGTGGSTLVVTPVEDIALAGAMVFIVGAIVRGYLWGTLNKDGDGTNLELTAFINTTTSCSEDEFQTYCELMKP